MVAEFLYAAGEGVRDGLLAVAEWEKDHGAFTADELDDARARIVDEVAAPARPRSA